MPPLLPPLWAFIPLRRYGTMGEQRYTALRTIATVLKALAWILAVACGLVFLGAIIYYAAIQTEAQALLVAVMSVFYSVFGFIYLYAGAEAILVILDIEENTRRSGAFLAQLAQQARPPAPPLAP
jgi:hypothetical protein